MLGAAETGVAIKGSKETTINNVRRLAALLERVTALPRLSMIGGERLSIKRLSYIVQEFTAMQLFMLQQNLWLEIGNLRILVSLQYGNRCHLQSDTLHRILDNHMPCPQSAFCKSNKSVMDFEQLVGQRDLSGLLVALLSALLSELSERLLAPSWSRFQP